MIANYHTHTWRCLHAAGTEREYVENAIKGGYKILGFSDHTPMPYPGGYVSNVKMRPDQLEGLRGHGSGASGGVPEGISRFIWAWRWSIIQGFLGSFSRSFSLTPSNISCWASTTWGTR